MQGSQTQLLLVNLEKIGSVFCGLCKSTFNNGSQNGKAQKLRRYIFIQNNQYLKNHFPETMSVFNIVIWGFGDMSKPLF